jgi:hypothetical protein
MNIFAPEEVEAADAKEKKADLDSRPPPSRGQASRE